MNFVYHPTVPEDKNKLVKKKIERFYIWLHSDYRKMRKNDTLQECSGNLTNTILHVRHGS